jgi:hypothetical protein
MAEYDRRSAWIAVFVKRNYGTIMKLNNTAPMHLSAASDP